MKTVGIIAEYNPFHNGHLYQIARAKELAGADYAVIVMSGNFTQRGTSALLDKYARCEMALHGGADLVIELPVCYASASAEYFAKGAVSILDSLKTDALCFGSECGEIEPLWSVARILSDEPEAFQAFLRENLRTGMSFPAARSLALEQFLAIHDTAFAESKSLSAACSLLQSPNNILGVEYLKALLKRNSSMEAYTLPRTGMGYLDTALPKDSFCSALAIRQSLFDGTPVSALSPFMPQGSLSILKQVTGPGYPFTMESFSSMLFYRLLSLQQEGYTDFADVTDALSDKITRFLENYRSYSQFCTDLLKSKDLTHSRISRSLLHILLGIKKQDMLEYAAAGDAFYARILGFKSSSKAVFGSLCTDSIPLISKLADAAPLLSPTGLKMLSQDIFAAHLYGSVAAQKSGGPIPNEYRRQIVIL